MPNTNETNPVPKDVYLDVEHVWQQDPEHNIPESERRTICAIACMKMAVDYLLPAQADTLSLHRMFEEMKADGAQNSNMHWKHAGEVDYFKKIGLVSWRRNWLAPDPNPHWFAENEGYNNEQLVAVSEQMIAEKGTGGYKEQAMHSIEESIVSGNPVIVSVAPHFSENKQDHQIVINGFGNSATEEWLYYVDPVLSPQKHQDRQKISREYFLKYFNLRAIFVDKPQAHL